MRRKKSRGREAKGEVQQLRNSAGKFYYSKVMETTLNTESGKNSPFAEHLNSFPDHVEIEFRKPLKDKLLPFASRIYL